MPVSADTCVMILKLGLAVDDDGVILMYLIKCPERFVLEVPSSAVGCIL